MKTLIFKINVLVSIFIFLFTFSPAMFSQSVESNAVKSEIKKPSHWGAIAIDIGSEESDPGFGIGTGLTKEAAELQSQKNCKELQGTDCHVMLSYQQCGAYAISDDNEGAGTGETKKIAEQAALQECGDNACVVLASSCINVK